jgi:D-alanyl-D-alanine carboxypeptidase
LTPNVPPPPVPTTRLQSLLEAKSKQWNTSFSVGVYHSATGSFGAVAGLADRGAAGKPATLDSRYPLGSVTKAYTAVAVMRQYEKGNLDIDLPIAIYVDPLLKRDNGTTLLELWRDDPMIQKVTGRMLLSMRSGIPDYDDYWFQVPSSAEIRL